MNSISWPWGGGARECFIFPITVIPTWSESKSESDATALCSLNRGHQESSIHFNQLSFLSTYIFPESYVSADDNPDEVIFLRLLSRHPKIKACLSLILSVISSLTPTEALLLLQEVHNDSEVLDTFQVWNESLLQASDPIRDEPHPTWETDGLSCTLS
ncbi:uncharacterized protein P174DRAFT_509559 [Aspergillus novofumigatus IBT 16806]|uniref:Uncharacterized protein n=1 Tax=Aspergillus novofumigatus (strain IBT 16806) TaxID=1392255 RepID=A0A2I1CF81_ASPN1|nr:uncharacterized protein P174DRAFT_509559 [Aspergillus novofumigatus IBT 16806]PKX96274.1 hypothetical protein P174DRAFT_509559 [Aspergillus novofumigatus IBT 16806]